MAADQPGMEASGEFAFFFFFSFFFFALLLGGVVGAVREEVFSLLGGDICSIPRDRGRNGKIGRLKLT